MPCAGYELRELRQPARDRRGRCRGPARTPSCSRPSCTGGDVALGDDVVLWSGAHVAHDSRIGDHCFIAPRAAIAGNVRRWQQSFIGVNATIRDGVTIAPRR